MPKSENGRTYHVVYPGIYIYDDPEPEPAPVEKPEKKDNDVRDILPMNDKVTAITVNYKTHDLMLQCIRTFRRHHPNILHILVDNGSGDDSAKLIKHYDGKPGYVVIVNSRNRGHGPAMHQAIKHIKTPFFLTLDSDVEIKRPFVGDMLKMFDNDDKLYAVGWLRMVDKISGVPSTWFTGQKPPPASKFIPYAHPYCGLYRTDVYRQLLPFFDHGAPCLDNMRDAKNKGWKVQQFKGIKDCVTHLEAGTRRMWDGDWHPGDKRKPKAWDAKRKFPI